MMKTKLNNKQMVILLGDVHGDWCKFYDKLNAGMLDYSLIIQLGDFGMGFLTNQDQKLFKLNKRLELHNSKLWVIRGNHDDPSFWQDDEKREEFNMDHPRIQLIPDYTTKNINGKKVLFVGGAISIDRTLRIRGKRTGWWKEEVTPPIPEGIEKHDIVLAHNCPTFCNHGIDSGGVSHYAEDDYNLITDLLKERKIMDEIYEKVEPRFWFSGHYHNTNRVVGENGFLYRCLDIDEMMELV